MVEDQHVALDELPTGSDRRAHKRINDLTGKFLAHLEQHHVFEAELKRNTEITEKIEKNTADIVVIIKGAKGLRGFIVWATPVVTTIIAVWAYIKATHMGG